MIRVFLVLLAVNFLNAQEPINLGSLLYKEVIANVETEPVFAGDDAADDMCVLENFNNPESSLIISSDKKYGIIVYDLEGVKLYFPYFLLVLKFVATKACLPYLSPEV